MQKRVNKQKKNTRSVAAAAAAAADALSNEYFVFFTVDVVVVILIKSTDTKSYDVQLYICFDDEYSSVCCGSDGFDDDVYDWK